MWWTCSIVEWLSRKPYWWSGMSFLLLTISATQTMKIFTNSLDIVESNAIGLYDASFSRFLFGLGIAITLVCFPCLGMRRSLKAALKFNVSMTNPLCRSSWSMRAVILSWPGALYGLSFFLMTGFIWPGLVSLIGWLLAGLTSGIKVGPVSFGWNVDLRWSACVLDHGARPWASSSVYWRWVAFRLSCSSSYLPQQIVGILYKWFECYVIVLPDAFCYLLWDFIECCFASLVACALLLMSCFASLFNQC